MQIVGIRDLKNKLSHYLQVARKGDPIILSASYDEITKKGDIAQNVALKNGDIIWVPRILIGDLNEFIRNSIPLLDYMFYPSKFRDAYGDSQNMRFLKK